MRRKNKIASEANKLITLLIISEKIDTLCKIEVRQIKMLEKLGNIDKAQKYFKNTQEKMIFDYQR